MDPPLITSTTTRGYLVHWDTNPTSEGLGSHCRGSLYPLLHIVLHLGLQPLWRTKNASWSNNLARDYSMLEIAKVFGLDHVINDDTSCKVLELNTWSDTLIGSCCGNAQLLVESIHDLLQHHEATENNNTILIYLHGPLKYMNPSPVVHRWLQDKCRQWDTTPSPILRVAAHVRVPEDFCGETWKEENSIQTLTQGLKKLKVLLSDVVWELHVYTEQTFRQEDEYVLNNEIGDVHVHRGSSETLLSDMIQMATADLFIPAASHLSALVGYLSNGGIVLTLPSRLEYFQCHVDLGCLVVNVWDEGSLSKMVQTLVLHEKHGNHGCQHTIASRIMG